MLHLLVLPVHAVQRIRKIHELQILNAFVLYMFQATVFRTAASVCHTFQIIPLLKRIFPLGTMYMKETILLWIAVLCLPASTARPLMLMGGRCVTSPHTCSERLSLKARILIPFPYKFFMEIENAAPALQGWIVWINDTHLQVEHLAKNNKKEAKCYLGLLQY